jgi:hypothetical protein
VPDEAISKEAGNRWAVLQISYSVRSAIMKFFTRQKC